MDQSYNIEKVVIIWEQILPIYIINKLNAVFLFSIITHINTFEMKIQNANKNEVAIKSYSLYLSQFSDCWLGWSLNRLRDDRKCSRVYPDICGIGRTFFRIYK